ncbi:MAG: NAD-dependent epimerase/dehydratase family protein, partial [Anaerolineales bacterium]|nr:NAD-dependent epimerase/dehydratase family protein [Anaerolineales bacterium]
MHILIPGGSGLVGQALTRNLLGDGHTVTILSRHAGNIAVPSGAQVLYWDGINTSGWELELERTDAVVHLAGESCFVFGGITRSGRTISGLPRHPRLAETADDTIIQALL